MHSGKMIFMDTETLGLHGELLCIQYSVDGGPIVFVDYPDWKGLSEFLKLLDEPGNVLCCYFAVFDVWHLYRFLHFRTGRLVKPFACRVLDLQVPAMLHGPFKNFAFSKSKSRAVARVRRIPRSTVAVVREKVLSAIRPHVPECFPILVGEHEVKGFKDLVTLSFSVDGRATLKAHAKYYGAPTVALAEVWPMVPRELEKPWCREFEEKTYEPYKAKALQVLADPCSPFVVYRKLDILFLRLLYEHLGRPEVDHHSDCVHAVAYTRYHGFGVDLEVLKRSKEFYEHKVNESQKALGSCNLKSSKQRLALLQSVDPLVASSAKKVLEVLAASDRPSRKLATAMVDFGKYRQRLLQVEKVLEAGRAYPSLRVMGTATGRMSGADGLNWQGIAQVEHDENGREIGIRAALKCGCGGDFEALEVTIAAAAYSDTQLQADLDAGVDFHAMTASMLPEAITKGWSYEYIRDNKKTTTHDIRAIGKKLNFSIIYGAQKTKVAEVIGCSEAEAQKFLDKFFGRYQGIGGFRRAQEKAFCTADTTHWSRKSVSTMKSSVTDLLGFTRTFDFEKSVATALWELGSMGLRTGVSGTVTRTKEKGQQTVDNAVKSALLGSAIAIQAAVWRQACNSPVQSCGANLTKILMADLWNLRKCPILNIHDELIVGPELTLETGNVVGEFLQKYREKVKSLNISMKPLERWSDK